MDIEKEIRIAFEKLNYRSPLLNSKKNDIEIIIKKYVEQFYNNDYDFSKTEPLVITKNNKKRYLKHFTELDDGSISIESILCQCVKQILDKRFKPKFPNRNKIMENLFGLLKAVKQMSDFIIVKFDFKDFYNSISSDYVFNKILDKNITDRFENALVNEYVNKITFTFAGLSPSSTISEIISKEFDSKIIMELSDFGLIFYERYIDDCFLILNNHIDKNELQEILNNVLLNVYHDKNVRTKKKCKTKFQEKKFIYISKRDIKDKLISINFLGYEFYFSKEKNMIKLQYGITEEKRKKNENRILEFIHDFMNKSSNDYNNQELLLQRLLAFCSRTVYQIKLSNGIIWREKGFISNYRELRFLIEKGEIECQTKKFIQNTPIKYLIKANINIPKIMLNQLKKNNLCNNLNRYRTLLLVNNLGYDYQSLSNICKKVGIEANDSNGKKKKYSTLVREYLIKLKVGY